MPFEGANSIKSALQTCNLCTGWSVSWFRLSLPPQMVKKITFANDQRNFFDISTFVIIEEMSSAKVLTADESEPSPCYNYTVPMYIL